MRWVLAFHIIFVVCWYAGLFYLPRLFVYHAECTDEIGNARFKVMERRLFYGIMLPASILATGFGFWLLYANIALYEHADWMHAKIMCVMLLWLYQIYCARLIYHFKNDNNQCSSQFYRWFNEIPSVFLIIIVVLVVVRPF
jgi:protoporphyrinogen IX oxidase